MRNLTVVVCSVLFAGLAWAQASPVAEKKPVTPAALKVGLVNNPPNDEEVLLYREIERSKPAPQGICVVNSAGKVLNWALMFDDDKSVLAFFDRAEERFVNYPDAKNPVAAEVYQKFPSQKRKDVEDSGKVLPALERHPAGKHCPAEPPLREGTVAVRGGPGDMHEVKLKWQGFVEMDGNRMARLVLSAGGMEKLEFQSRRGKEENLVAFLRGGHRIDMECGVRYGIIGEPVAADKPKQPQKPAAGADVFGHDKVWQFHLTLSAAEYAAMQPAPGKFPGGPGDFPGGFPGGPMPPPKLEPNPGEPKRDAHRSAFGIEFPWAVASLTTDGKTIEKVGLRYKGNSTYVRASRNLKRSLKVDIDRHDDAARFHGLKSLTLSNGVMDPSQSREALAYSIYRAAGVPAPRTAFAEVTLTVPGKYDKEHVGLYTLIEGVDKNFLKLNFKNNAGLLMKPERIPGLVYLGEDWARYKDTYLPKREATQDEIKRVIDFTRLVNATPDKQFNEEIASYLDVDAFLKFMAVTAIVANFDSFHGGHNYCLYLHPETNKFHFIPWDLDLALGGFPMLVVPEQMDLSLTKPYAGQSQLADRLMANREYADKYHQILKEVVPLCFAKEKLLTEIAVIEKIVKPLIEREMTAIAARKENAGGPGGPGGAPDGMGWFGHPAADLKTFVEQRSESIAAQLAGQSKGYTPVGFGPPGGPGMGGPGGGRPNPGEAGRQLTEMLGPPFLVFRDKVQDELKLSDEQKQMLQKRLQDTIPDAMQFFQKLGDKQPEERQKELHAYVEKAQVNLTAFLQGLLQPEQFNRLRQVMLQRDRLFALLGNADVAKELEIADKQRQQFDEVAREMQKKIEPLMKEAQSGGNPQEIGPKIMKIRKEQVDRIEALLSDAQKKQWKKMLGKPLALDD